MRAHFIAFLALALLPISPVLADPTAEELAASQKAADRGAEMYAYDQAAWHATDRFMADLHSNRVTLDQIRARGLQGYVAEPGSDGKLLVTFYAELGGIRSALARYAVLGSEVTGGGILDEAAERSISAVANRMIAAREAAIAAMHAPDHGLCSSSPPNTLVLPPDSDDRISAYVLTSTETDGVYPAGGHYRFDFDATGVKVSERRFMNSCFALDWRSQGSNRPEAMVLSHLLDPEPTEIHAFVSRNIPIGLMIVTVQNHRVWAVENGRIRFAQDIPAR